MKRRMGLKRTLRSESLEQRQLLHGGGIADNSVGTLPPSESTVVEFASIDGTGNNLLNSDLGSAGETLIRAADADYADGFSVPAGEDRPSAREISNLLANDEGQTSDRLLSAFVYVWGQFVDHDISLSRNGGGSFDISVPTGDPYFDPFGTGTETIPLTRSLYDIETGVDTPRQQVNAITAWIDGSAVYGSDDATATALRTLAGGKLKTSDGDMLPFNNAETFPNGTLPMDNDARIVPDEELFAAGDVRANENIELTAIQTLFVREHNRLADEIGAADPTLTDEAVYQRARSIVIGELQAITYNEWLPSFLGERSISRYEGYDSSVDPTITNEFSTAAFRFGHSLLGDDVEFLDNEGNEIGEEVPLSHAFSNPALVSENGIDSIIKYLASDPSGELDIQIVDGVRNFLFGPPGSGGLDLASLNIQRGRDHGLDDYNSTRVAYGLDPVETFADITSDPEMQTKLEQLYGSVDNIDLWVGGLVEDHVQDASIGETFRAIISDQFERLRDGDRFWYENVFFGSRLREIDRTSLSDVIERNTDLTNLQDDVFFFDSSISGRVLSEAEAASGRRRGRTRPGQLAAQGIDGQIVQLLTSDGELVAETTTNSRGQYRFDVLDGVRTGQYQLQLMTADDSGILSPVNSREVSITTGDIHIRGMGLLLELDENVEPQADTEGQLTGRPPRVLAADLIFAGDTEQQTRRPRR